MSDPAGFAAEQLRSFVERIERLDEEIKALNDDKRDVYGEAKANGFDVKILRQVIRLRTQDADERHEQETILDLYLAALGMLPGRDVPPRVHVHAREGGGHVGYGGQHDPADVKSLRDELAEQLAAQGYDPDTGEIIETRAAGVAPGGAAENREGEAIGSAEAEATAPAPGEPTFIAASKLARRYPVDARGVEHAGDLPDFLRRT